MQGRDKRKWDKKRAAAGKSPSEGRRSAIPDFFGHLDFLRCGIFCPRTCPGSRRQAAASSPLAHRSRQHGAFLHWVTVASFFRLLSEAPGSVLVAPGMATILAIVDRKYRVLWITVVVFALLGAGAIAFFFFWILSMF
jgi:hypothetical protein